MSKLILPKPTLILAAGVPAAGKSTTAKELPKFVSDIVYIEKDIIMNAFLSTPAEGELGRYLLKETISVTEPFYKNSVRDQTYFCMLTLAKENLRIGLNPVLESSYVKEIQQGYIDKVILPMVGDKYAFKFLFFTADRETIWQRLKQRDAARDVEKLSSQANFDAWLAKEPLLPPQIHKYSPLIVDTTQPVSDNVHRVIDYLLQ